jgi:hypothetical protein
VPLVAGIDEAGYGPTLGPLVVGATLWNIPPNLTSADHWDLLRDCVRRSVRRGDWRLAVNDSKAVYNRKRGISTLERSVLAFASAAGVDLTTFDTLLAGVGTGLHDTERLDDSSADRPVAIEVSGRFRAVKAEHGRDRHNLPRAAGGSRDRGPLQSARGPDPEQGRGAD